MSLKESPQKGKEPKPLRVAKLTKTKVLLVDDHPTMREGLMRVIEREADMAVCGEAESIQRALEVVEMSKPDIAIVDISLAGQNGIELIKDLKVRHPHLPVLVHSMHDESVYAERSLRAGAKGYISKKEPPQKLLQAIRDVLHGEISLSATMTRHILHTVGGDRADRKTSPFRELSDREFEVFELTGQGLGTKEIAGTLHLSEKTVQAHRDHIRQKLHLPDGRSLTGFAIRWVESQS
ncbi:MAG TPA: response regulator transcription factor [Verrucomicrobiae bacterium]|nr:response regulator transcription factor [Verrucomicrobiae bacterium]